MTNAELTELTLRWEEARSRYRKAQATGDRQDWARYHDAMTSYQRVK